MKEWEIIAEQPQHGPVGVWAACQPWNSCGRTIWIVDAHRGDGKRFIVHADEKLTAFIELESAIFARAYLAGYLYKISEPNSPSLTRVRIFIFGLTTAVVRMIWPRSFMVML
jgi:hypothetical protein